MTSARDRAQQAQLQASDPAVSAFVAASAGSGKTKLLTDRLLRLMLAGAAPGRIQCLTFTKAAAAEMALRLQRMLGEWVTLDDAALDDRLRALHVTPGDAARRKARALFAEVLDLPGGMRIGTIHAFCQSLLRRFPLEAALSPHFGLVDDTDADIALTEARESLLAASAEPVRAALAELAGLVTADAFGGLVKALLASRDRLAALAGLDPARIAAAQRAALGVPEDEAAVVAAAVAWQAERDVRAAAGRVAAEGTPSAAEKAQRLLAWLSLDLADRTEHWAEWCEEFLRPDGQKRGPSVFANKRLTDRDPALLATFLAEQDRVAEVQDRRRAVRVARVSAALMALAAPVAAGYATRKEAASQLDFDDLIGRTSRLLVDPGAAWVLYKLDGGLDHLLLDEVQDTAPAQWHIAGRLTEEFFAGEGARDTSRTVFAVGDRKQSIYAFQGADPDAFEHWRGIMRQRVRDAGASWQDVALDVSFRSTAPVLQLVDHVFTAPDAAEGVAAAGSLRHIADRALHAGRVELWPPTPAPEMPESEPWTVPERNLGAVGAETRLAAAIADWIAARIGRVRLDSRDRPLAAGDFLVLVRRRNRFGSALMRALKARDVPVAGLDRMMLTEQPAVADLLALCDVLLLPEDDLQLACVLTSPLGGLDDEALMALAAERHGPLWDTLRRRADERPDWGAAHRFIAALLARADFASPHALLAEALGPLGGRARLFARLGPEAAEPVDELLHAALRYARLHPPSLQGFLHWLRQSAAEVKRETEGAGAAVRIMTVHGAKGLQAPVVILPDTTALPPEDGRLLWVNAEGIEVPLWSPRREIRSAAIDRMRAASRARAEAEHNRLLYVALTRAEDHLVICGWETRRARPDGCWYDKVRRGFDRAGAAPAPFATVPDAWAGEMFVLAAPQHAPPDRATGNAGVPAAPLPPWAGTAPAWRAAPPPPEPDLPTPLAPSRPEHAELGGVPQAASPLAGRDAGGTRFRRGQLIHGLLQHLPALPAPDRRRAAERFLARPGQGLPPAEIGHTVGEVLGILEDPALAPLFGPEGRAEVPLTGIVANQVVGGLVDRLAVLPGRVLVADYKTNRVPPLQVEDVPRLYLRQMAAYRAVLRQIFPGRAVECLLVWTSGARVMPLPETLLDRHAPGAGAAA
jgi:ATP-dependent helicase/nuclease subunit A